jgi:hypothetical protein
LLKAGLSPAFLFVGIGHLRATGVIADTRIENCDPFSPNRRQNAEVVICLAALWRGPNESVRLRWPFSFRRMEP